MRVESDVHQPWVQDTDGPARHALRAPGSGWHDGCARSLVTAIWRTITRRCEATLRVSCNDASFWPM